MSIYRKLYVLIFGLILFGMGVPHPVLSAQWDNIPEKYKIETIIKLYEKNDIDTIVERCDAGIKDKTLPNEYKSILYTVRAKTYFRTKEAINKENGIKAGLDCIRSNQMDPKNLSCVEVIQAYLSTTFLMSQKKKTGEFTEKDAAEFEKRHEKIKGEFLADLEKKAREEKLEGVDDFFKKLSKNM